MTILQEAIKRGIADADPDARSFARKAYWGFADHFKVQADVLLNSLEGVHRKMLQAGEMSNSSSSNSLNMSSGKFFFYYSLLIDIAQALKYRMIV